MAIGSDELAARKEMAWRLGNTAFLTNAIQAAVRAAILEHKQAGNPIADWQDGRVVIVAPEDIRVPGEEEAGADGS